MQVSNVKEIKIYCQYCKTETRMSVMRPGPSSDSHWLKCKQCSLYKLINVTELTEMGKKQAEIKKKKLANSEQPVTTESVPDYDARKTFLKGQKLYHPGFKDCGTIKKVSQGSGDFQKILVKFEHVGEKLLVQSIS
ncbi:MAG: hypothetical protein SCK70_03370 [bacterium]|nr:hypothetical protein [bacterium]